MGNFNLLGNLSISFISIATFCWIIYVGLLFTFCGDPLDKDGNTTGKCAGGLVKIAFTVSKYAGCFFTAGAIICLILNRTRWAGGESKGNWDNAYFYSGISILLGAILLALSLNFVDCNNLDVHKNTAAKILRLVTILFFVISGWLLMSPDF